MTEPNPNMKSAPFFSFIMPVYNAAQFLRESLKCMLAQDFQDWEAVLVDDCSTDGSMAIAEEFSRAYPKIRLLTSGRNSGSAYTPRMLAAASASGRYLVTLDADDQISADYLSLLHESIVAHDADITLTEMWRLTGEISEKILPLDSIDAGNGWKGRDLVGHTLVRWEISMNGFAIKRSLYLEADQFITPEDKKSIFADELLSRWILSICGKATICKARYHYRQNAGSVTHVNLPRVIASRMHTADGLISMTETTFGPESPTYIKAIENKLYSAIDMMRLINSTDLDRTAREACMSSVSNAMKGFDLSSLKGKTSPRYLALMRLPLPLASLTLRILDPILRK